MDSHDRDAIAYNDSFTNAKPQSDDDTDSHDRDAIAYNDSFANARPQSDDDTNCNTDHKCHCQRTAANQANPDPNSNRNSNSAAEDHQDADTDQSLIEIVLSD
jgi:hypothetical protein